MYSPEVGEITEDDFVKGSTRLMWSELQFNKLCALLKAHGPFQKKLIARELGG